MAKDYSKQFYNSSAWRKLRAYIRNKYNNTCQECGEFGDQVHHIIEITPENINDPNITLNEDNLTLLCDACHNAKKRIVLNVNEGLYFDEKGNMYSNLTPPQDNDNKYF